MTGGGAPIVVLGDVMVDVVCRLDGPIAPGSDAPARIEFGFGGSAANVAAWLAAAGARPALVGRIGADERGRAAAEELRSAGVEARLVVDGEAPSGTCVVLVGPDGERSMIPDPGANDRLAVEDLPDSLLGSGATCTWPAMRCCARARARLPARRSRGHGRAG